VAVGRIRVGTSGWSYDHWAAGVFYPEHLAQARRLEYYASRFDTVEVDATFYRLPSEHAVRVWHDTVPEHFRFAVKGSRSITHFRRLGDIDEALASFSERMSGLGGKLGVVLWQLPPNLKADAGLLSRFLRRLPDMPARHAIEFRHDSWSTEEIRDLLGESGVANVWASNGAATQAPVPTADFVYVRFHGTSVYHGAYDHPALEPWARLLREQATAQRDCYAYFNNDAQGHAPQDAQRLVQMLETGSVHQSDQEAI